MLASNPLLSLWFVVAPVLGLLLLVRPTWLRGFAFGALGAGPFLDVAMGAAHPAIRRTPDRWVLAYVAWAAAIVASAALGAWRGRRRSGTKPGPYNDQLP